MSFTGEICFWRRFVSDTRAMGGRQEGARLMLQKGGGLFDGLGLRSYLREYVLLEFPVAGWRGQTRRNQMFK